MKDRLRGAKGGLILLAVLIGILAGCASRDQLTFPEYEPTKVFLARQELIQRWAREIREKREIEIRLNLVRGLTKTYREWKPIYGRIENYQTWLESQRQEDDR